MYNYNKTELQHIANETDFLRDNLEKVFRLAEILQYFSETQLFSENLALKGGTALNLAVLNMPRLSVDIDLDFCKTTSRDEMLKIRELINSALLNYMFSNMYALSPHTKNPHSLDSWAFYFQNAAGNRDVLKVEINYSMREHIFPAEKRKIKSEILNADFQINTLAEIELFGSKIKALIERAAARDLYDVHNIINHNAVNSDNKELLRKIIIFYLTVGGKNEIILPFTFENINKLKFPKIRSTLVPVLRKSENFDFETAKTEVINFLADLMKLPKNEIDFIKKFEQGLYQPELLFDDAQIIARIKEHPMAIWRTKNIK